MATSIDTVIMIKAAGDLGALAESLRSQIDGVTNFRIVEGSLELHVKYSVLDADGYSKIQPWPEHQRPSRWVIDLATQKAQSLKVQV